MPGYAEDLAYIHDTGHTEYARQAAPGLLALLRRHGVREGLIVDLGCGSGRWARELNRAGYQVLGVDQSPAMVRLARRIAPASRFRVGSLFRVRLPPCSGITSIGECLNYRFDAWNSRAALVRLFRRAHRALRPGGVLVFDVAGPDRLPPNGPRHTWSAGRDWAVMSSTFGKRSLLVRHIVCFRRHGELYRRSEEVHELRLYRAADLAVDLAGCGFEVCTLTRFGRFRLPPGISGLLAVKP